MQRLARELRLSESVFVLPARAGGDVAIRIFTPGAELPFAGHPVLGTAVVVVSGWMSQPVPSWAPYEREVELLAALGVARSGLPVEVYDNGPHHLYVE